MHIHTHLGDITLHQSLTSSDPLLDEFMEHYDQAFVLPDEKETREGLSACLALNAGPRHDELAGRLGPYFETIVVAKDAQGRFVGGINMMAYTAPGAGPDGNDAHGIALNYIFVHREFRRQGLLPRLVGAARDLAGQHLGAPAQSFMVFLEMNNPTRMNPGDIELDSRLSGIDQDARLFAWERAGARVIDTQYIQPALSDDGKEPEAGLLLAVIPPHPADTLPAKTLQAHLTRFFEISVLKGQALPEVASAQIHACENRGREGYALLPPTQFAGHLRPTGLRHVPMGQS